MLYKPSFDQKDIAKPAPENKAFTKTLSLCRVDAKVDNCLRPLNDLNYQIPMMPAAHISISCVRWRNGPEGKKKKKKTQTTEDRAPEKGPCIVCNDKKK
jgi:hypothetical protein